ncbi:MAG: GerMN domain-containing protein [Acidimicrobiales bacterium]|jgi:hypothetical protein
MTGAARRRIAAVAVMGAVLSTTACGIPTATGPTAIAKSAVPYHLLGPPTTNSSVPGTAPEVGVSEQIFLVAPSGHLVAADREVAVPAALSQVLGALLAGPTATESASGVQSYLSGAGVDVTATQAGGVATVRFSADPIQVVGPDQTMAIAQVVYTVTQQPGITGVDFEIAGKAVEVPTAAGVQVPGPVGRSDYVPQAPLP